MAEKRITAHRSCVQTSGYTFVELLLVLAILALLAGMVVPLTEVTYQRQKERELKRALWAIRDAIDAFHQARLSGTILGSPGSSTYPSTLAALEVSIPDARPEHRGEYVRFLRNVPRDPFADPALPAGQTWGLRCFLSEASDPRPGVDVYDVYSRSDRQGLNGVPLAQW